MTKQSSFRVLATALLCLLTCWSIKADDVQWQAKWIGKHECNGATNSWLAVRTKFQVDKVPEKLLAQAAADSKYWVWINGQLAVFEGGLKSGPEMCSTYYDEFDIAPYLREGENQIAILLWYFGKNGFSYQAKGAAALIFQAIGEGIHLVTDRTWEASIHFAYQTCGEPLPNFRLPESSILYDARLDIYPGWNTGGYTESIGKAREFPFEIGQPPMGKLYKRPIPMFRFSELKPYTSVTQRGDTLVCRLPYNCHFTPYIMMEAPEGKKIEMRTDHYVVAGIYNIRAEYITREGEQEYENLGWMNGEEMYYIVPSGIKVKEVKYRESSYDTDITGAFSCNDTLLNNYWTKAARTLCVCMRDTYMDCPDRERAQWWGDEVNHLGIAFYTLSPSSWALARKGICELVGWQRPNGILNAPIPCGNYFHELPFQMLAAVGWYGFYTYYLYSGDNSFVKQIYAGVHRNLHTVWQTDSLGLPIYRTGDWDWPDAGINCDQYALLPPWYYLALKAEREFAKMLNLHDDVEEITRMMQRIEENYNKVYWNGSEYRSKGFDSTPDDRVQAMAVVSGLAKPSQYPAIIKALKQPGHATTYMHRYVLEALYMMNQPDMALELMHKRYPTIMKDECSTLWEHWDFEGTSNHAWAGAGVIAMGSRIAGIRPIEPGFRVFRVAPQLGSLTNVDATVPTAYGPIKASIQRKGRRIQLHLSVPNGTTAYITMRNGADKQLEAGEHDVNL